jgi:hypothetical protein
MYPAAIASGCLEPRRAFGTSITCFPFRIACAKPRSNRDAGSGVRRCNSRDLVIVRTSMLPSPFKSACEREQVRIMADMHRMDQSSRPRPNDCRERQHTQYRECRQHSIGQQHFIGAIGWCVCELVTVRIMRERTTIGWGNAW